MKRLVEFPTEDGGSILVEVEDTPRSGQGFGSHGSLPSTSGSPSGTTLRGFGSGRSSETTSPDMFERARISYEHALDRIQSAAETIITKMRDLSETPDEVSVEFGIKLSADIGAFLASTSAEAQFILRLTWKRPEVALHSSSAQRTELSSGDTDLPGGPS